MPEVTKTQKRYRDVGMAVTILVNLPSIVLDTGTLAILRQHHQLLTNVALDDTRVLGPACNPRSRALELSNV